MPLAGPSIPASRRTFLIGALGGLGLLGMAARPGGGGRPLPLPLDPETPVADRPNLVVILSDDHRWDHMSFHPGAPPFLQTPSLDRLAAEGTVGANAFVTTALCSPSRGTVLSGQYASRHGVVNNLSAWNPQTETFFEPLQRAGYRTALIGKWHMPGALPDLRGLDLFVTFTAEEGQGQYEDCPLLVNGEMVERPNTYITTDLTDLAIEWIDAQPAGQPWCLYLAHKAVHHPFTPPADLAGTYANVSVENLPPESFAFMSLMDRNIWEGTQGRLDVLYRRYCETLLGLDREIGRLVDHIDATGARDNTYVIYSSDNGYSWGEHVLTGKRWPYEENTRVPLIVTGPGVPGGQQLNELIINADFAPTLTDWGSAAGLPAAQGRSLADLLTAGGSATGTTAPTWRSDFLYEYFPDYPYQVPGLQAVRTDGWLYAEFDRGLAPQLYDVATDPRTQNDLIDVDPTRAAELASRLGQLRADVTAGRVV